VHALCSDQLKKADGQFCFVIFAYMYTLSQG
jgi:hypothetical protein